MAHIKAHIRQKPTKFQIKWIITIWTQGAKVTKMLRIITTLIMSLYCLFGVALAKDAPLVTIRFNQPEVHFSKQLKQAVGMALSTKADTLFTVIVSYKDDDQHDDAEHVASVFQQLIRESGAAPSNITTAVQEDEAIAYNEVSVYVK
jgi:hypothetical protein